MQQTKAKNRLMGQAFIKVRSSITNAQKQHYESLRNLVSLYLMAEPDKEKRDEIYQIYLDKLDAAQW